MYISRLNSPIHIDLLYFKEHYAWIKDFSRLFEDITTHNSKHSFANDVSDNLVTKVHTNATRSFATARITSQHFTYFQNQKARSNLQTGNTSHGRRLLFTRTLSLYYYQLTNAQAPPTFTKIITPVPHQLSCAQQWLRLISSFICLQAKTL